MADEKLLDFDPVSGMKEWISTDEDGVVRIRYEQDVQPILDANKARQAESFDKRADLWHAATVPVGVQMEWLVKHGVQMWNPDHRDGVKRLLNDPQYRYLRVKNFIL